MQPHPIRRLLGVLSTSVAILCFMLTDAEGRSRFEHGHCVSGARHAHLARPDVPASSDDRGFDVLHYDLSLDVGTSSLDGSVTITATATVDDLTDVVLDLYDAYLVSNVTSTSNGVDAILQKATFLRVTLSTPVGIGETFDLSLDYQGTPPSVAGPVTQDPFTWSSHGDPGSEAPVIFTLSVPYRSGAWWPCKEQLEDKATIDLAVTVDNGLVVASNGVRGAVTPAGPGRNTHEWSHGHPVAPYLVSLAISNYVRIDDSVDVMVDGSPVTVPLEYYVYPELVADATADLAHVPASVIFFSEKWGPYPFRDEKYGVALIDWGGGMEHQTCVSVGSQFVTGNGNFEWLFVHELAHQWWGDWITVADWRDVWLNEGFATYAEAMWEEERFGYQEYLSYMRDLDPFPPPTFSGYVSAIYDPAPLYGDAPYDKGAWVLHMLRHIVGDAAFWDIFPAYAEERGNGNTTTDDFVAVAEAISGMSLRPFFDQWIFPDGRPEYAFRWGSERSGSEWIVSVHIDQRQLNLPVYEMPIPLSIITASGTVGVIADNVERHQTFTFTVDSEPLDVSFDPDRLVLRNIPVTEVVSPSLLATPNPFRSEGRITYSLASEGAVTLRIYDVMGRRVRTLVDGRRQQDAQLVTWDGRNDEGSRVGAGVYYVELTTPSASERSRIVYAP